MLVELAMATTALATYDDPPHSERIYLFIARLKIEGNGQFNKTPILQLILYPCFSWIESPVIGT